jgi:anaerobic sulfite reductase subunit C
MSHDIDRKAVTRNAYRVTSRRNETCLRIRVPGGHLPSRHLATVQKIADTFGNGTVHLTSRQGFEVPGISFAAIPDVNLALAPLLADVETVIGVNIDDPEAGYPAAGTRNVSACIGSRVCPFANYDTTALAQRIERELFPNHYHVKIGLTGCPNDCAKAHMQDFGIIGQARVEIDPERCVGCEACVKNCRKRVTEALRMVNYRAVRDERRCIGCGECVSRCPVNAWTRNPTPYFRMVVLGRTGKRNPRLAATFLEWVTEDVVVQVLRNAYAFIDEHIDRSLGKEHLGYIVDRVGYPLFRDAVLDGVSLPPGAKLARTLEFHGYWYERDRALPKPEDSSL